MNTKIKPWSDVHVRRAVAYALNRSAIIVANGGAGSSAPADTVVPPSDLRTRSARGLTSARCSSQSPQYPFSLAKAKQEMAESAYPKGFTATTDTTNFGSLINVNQVIVAELQKIGITLHINVKPVADWVTEIYGRKTFGDMYSTIPHLEHRSERTHLLIFSGASTCSSGGLNCADYTPKSVDELLGRGLSTSNPAKRLTIYGELLTTGR